MSVQYLLDGYNIIHQMPELAKHKLEDGRHHLVSLIERYRPQGSSKNSITVIFDGKSGVWGESGLPGVKVLFSQDESADDKIKRMVAGAKNKKNYIVVTDDREIKYSVRAEGAKVLSVQEFVRRLKPKQKINQGGVQPSKSGTESKKQIPKTVEYKITQEFEDIWLKKNKKKSK